MVETRRISKLDVSVLCTECYSVSLRQQAGIMHVSTPVCAAHPGVHATPALCCVSCTAESGTLNT